MFFSYIQSVLRVLKYFPNSVYELIPMSTEELKQPAKRPLVGGFVKTKFSSEYPEFLFSNVDDFLKESLSANAAFNY